MSLILVPALVAALGAWLTGVPSKVWGHFNPEPTISSTVSFFRGDCATFVVPGNLDDLGPAPMREELKEWAMSRGGAQADVYHGPAGGGMGMIMVTVTGYKIRPVTIIDLNFTVWGRSAPLAGSSVSNECGDETIARFAEVDLDVSPPQIGASSAVETSLQFGDVRSNPLRFPYDASNSDTEALLLIPHTRGFVEWTASLEWSDGENTGALTIDNDGEPFRTTAPLGSNPSAIPNGDGTWFR
jgi:hypothetical protein